MYKKTLDLNPANKKAKEILEELLAERK